MSLFPKRSPSPHHRHTGMTSRLGDCCTIRRNGFTLIELIIVLAILSTLSAIVIAQIRSVLGAGRNETMATNVDTVRRLVLYHATSDDPGTIIGPSGRPDDIYPHWFASGHVPVHTWTSTRMVIEVVDGAYGEHYPSTKVFNLGKTGVTNAWYNRTNGRFCALVGAEASDAETLESFNTANAVKVTSLGAVN